MAATAAGGQAGAGGTTIRSSAARVQPWPAATSCGEGERRGRESLPTVRTMATRWMRGVVGNGSAGAGEGGRMKVKCYNSGTGHLQSQSMLRTK